jgi:signal transduction histidine kinase
VRFSAEDEAALRALHPVAKPHFQRISEVFYDRILDHPEARRALEGGESQVGRLKVTLVAWMEGLLLGPWDEVYFEKRARIGRVHVRIGLPQHYMFGAMNVMRRELKGIVESHSAMMPARMAVDKILDLELAIMLHTFREDLLAQQARMERLSTFGQLSGAIGHELRNPLGVIESSLYVLRSHSVPDERMRKHLDRIGEQVDTANRIVSSLLEILRDAPLAHETVSLSEVLERAVSAVARPGTVDLVVEGLADLPAIHGSSEQLRQVFVNLLQNAVQALPKERGRIRVVGRRNANGVEVVVEDNGSGVDETTRRRLFEPLITARKGGVGLGLALVKRIAERHGGTISHEPAAPGARFKLQLPV